MLVRKLILSRGVTLHTGPPPGGRPFHTFLYKKQRTVYMRNHKVGSEARVTLDGGSLALKGRGASLRFSLQTF